jgi:hypothetical protein
VALIESWLEAEPTLGSRTALDRLITHNPERYGHRHLRNRQRRRRGYCLQRTEQEWEQVLDPATRMGKSLTSRSRILR